MIAVKDTIALVFFALSMGFIAILGIAFDAIIRAKGVK